MPKISVKNYEIFKMWGLQLEGIPQDCNLDTVVDTLRPYQNPENDSLQLTSLHPNLTLEHIKRIISHHTGHENLTALVRTLARQEAPNNPKTVSENMLQQLIKLTSHSNGHLNLSALSAITNKRKSYNFPAKWDPKIAEIGSHEQGYLELNSLSNSFLLINRLVLKGYNELTIDELFGIANKKNGYDNLLSIYENMDEEYPWSEKFFQVSSTMPSPPVAQVNRDKISPNNQIIGRKRTLAQSFFSPSKEKGLSSVKEQSSTLQKRPYNFRSQPTIPYNRYS